MWSRFRAPAGHPRRQNPTAPGDGATLLNGPLRIDWTAEAVSFRLFFPQPFAATYAYPLIVFLHDEAGSDVDLSDWFPEVSGQNFLAAAVKAPFPHKLGFPGKFSWRGRQLGSTRQIVEETVSTIAQLWRIHPERIYLMGVGVGAELALRLALNRQGQFAGAIAVDCGRTPELAAAEPTGSGKRILMVQRRPAAGRDRLSQDLEDLGHMVHTLEQNQGESTLDIYAAVNHWLMTAIPTTVW